LPRARKWFAATLGVVAASMFVLGTLGSPAVGAPTKTAAITTASDSPVSPDICALPSGGAVPQCFPEPPDQCGIAPTTVTGSVSRSPYYNIRADLTYCFSRLGEFKLQSGIGVRAFFTPPLPDFTGAFDFSIENRRVTDTFVASLGGATRTVQFEVQLCNFVEVLRSSGAQVFQCFATEFPYIQITVSKTQAPVVKQGISTFPGIP
jgi:hypothetical protein